MELEAVRLARRRRAVPMPQGVPLLSIVCPAYEEADGLPHFHRALDAALEPLRDTHQVEIVYVDDGSRDATLNVLRDLVRLDGRVRYMSLSRNFGNQAALTAGLEHARGDAVVTIDSDLQHPPTLIPEMIDHWQNGADVVVALREGKQGLSWFKRVSSSWFHRLLRRCSDLDMRPEVSDYRLLSRPVLDALLGLREQHRYLRAMVQWLGFRVAEVTFRPDERRVGTSKFTLGKLVRLAADGLLSFSRVPLRLAIGGGLALTAMSLAASLAVALSRHADPVLVALLIAVHLIGGGILAAVGVVGSYVVRVYEESKGRPLYVLKEASPVLAAPAQRDAA
jgi:dolichol-phosphate mannosyltransferase